MKLKEFIRVITPRNWRCHRRRVFFQRLFTDMLSEFECHSMAGSISYYPFEKRREIPIGKVSPDFSDDTKATINRISPVWIIFFGFGKFDVTINNTNFQRWIWLW